VLDAVGDEVVGHLYDECFFELADVDELLEKVAEDDVD
jgi:hypothetical protein